MHLLEICYAGIATHLDVCSQYLCSYVKWNCCISSLKVVSSFTEKKMSIIRRPVTYSAGLVNLWYFWKPSFHGKLIGSFALKIQIYNHGEKAIAPSCFENMNESNSQFLTKEAVFYLCFLSSAFTRLCAPGRSAVMIITMRTSELSYPTRVSDQIPCLSLIFITVAEYYWLVCLKKTANEKST